MIQIENVTLPDGKIVTHTIDCEHNETIDGKGLTLLPAVIDPHVHFRTPGHEYKENWESAAKAAIAGGVTTVMDMPNTNPATITCDALREKKALIDSQLKNVNVPLRYSVYLGADEHHLDEIGKAKGEAIAIKIYMGSSTGNLVMDKKAALDRAFAIAAEHDMIIAVHAEDEEMIQERSKIVPNTGFPTHSIIRNPEVAVRATEEAIALSAKHGTRLYLAHISTKDELPLIATAKKAGTKVYAETSPHHLFLDTSAYETMGGKAQVNPPIRTADHGAAIFEAAKTGIIDTIGSDHAPHTREEKSQPYGKAPSGIPGMETMLPLLLNAHAEGKISLDQIITLTSKNSRKIFSLPETSDVVLVDLTETRTLTDEMIVSKTGWTPFAGRTLTGWPKITICNGKVFKL